MPEGMRRRLDSWKEIAEYLGRNTKTVARWEKHRGLPVHRVPGGRARTVFAFSDELDHWMEGVGSTLAAEDATSLVLLGASLPGYIRRRWVLVTAALLSVAISTLGWSVWTARSAPWAIQVLTRQGRTVVASTATGTVAWSFTPEFPIKPADFVIGWSDVGDLDGRPGSEAVAGLMGSWEAPDSLTVFTNRGDVLWQRILNDQVSFGGSTYGPPWRSLAVRRFEVDGQPRVGWTVHHHTWWPSLFVVFDGTGRPLDRFVHQGWLSSIRATADGRHILVAGAANAHNAYALAVLDARHPSGSPPPPEDPQFACGDCPPGRPLRYLLLGRSELAALLATPLHHPGKPAEISILPSGAVEVRVQQTLGDAEPAEAIFEFDADLRLRRSRVNDTYWTWHRELERAGRVTHTADQCPDRRGLSVREWTPNAGWRELPIH